MLPTLDEVRSAADVVRAVLPATPQFCWPLLCERTGAEVWVKHENHQPVGAFKIRGGIVLIDQLVQHPILDQNEEALLKSIKKQATCIDEKLIEFLEDPRPNS